MIKQDMTATFYIAGHTTHLHLSRPAVEAISFNRVVILLAPDSILIRRAGIDDRRTHKLSTNSSGGGQIGLGISKIRNYEDYIGHYSVYRQDEDTFILTKIDDNSNT